MKPNFKIISILIMCGISVQAMATNRFIIKYKPNATQAAFLLAHQGVDKKKAEEYVREQLMWPLSQEKIDALSKAAGVQAKDFMSIATGAHVIILTKDLNEKQTEQFIRIVQQDNSVAYIVEEGMLSAASALEP